MSEQINALDEIRAGHETVDVREDRILQSILRFVHWLDEFGEVSHDFQSFYAGRLGKAAKAMYYRRPHLGILAVSPMVFCEAIFPAGRRLFWKRQRFPIGDAHYAMAFFLLANALEDERYQDRGLHFLQILEKTRCAGFKHHCWGYPYDWVTLRGTIKAGTPLITTVPYVYEAFKLGYKTCGDSKWLGVMESIAQHALEDYKDIPTSAKAFTCSYTPDPKESISVVNANAYRAFLLISASKDFANESYLKVGKGNLNFVLEAQNPDGSWFYANDGQRNFTDHFHTCFVLKALAKIEALTGDRACTAAIERGVSYYVDNLFDERGLPKPFSRRPRLTVYRRELYDYAECLNLGALLQGRFAKLDRVVSTALDDVLSVWQKRDGSFRSRRLYAGWDNTPMHRWGESQTFRSLCFLLSRSKDCRAAGASRRDCGRGPYE